MIYARHNYLRREVDSAPHPLKWAAMRAAVLVRSCMLLLLVGVLFTGCASVPKDYPRTPSTAFPDYASTTIGAYFEKAAASHPGQSGFAIFPDGRRAFTSRIAMTGLAEKTLDLQYFSWDADATGRILAERLVRAADRGVRVRILVDDLNLKGRDAVVAALDAHPKGAAAASLNPVFWTSSGRIRRKHDSIRTEQGYVDSIRRFVLDHNKRHPCEIGCLRGESHLPGPVECQALVGDGGAGDAAAEVLEFLALMGGAALHTAREWAAVHPSSLTRGGTVA
jgi:hypothetical protein